MNLTLSFRPEMVSNRGHVEPPSDANQRQLAGEGVPNPWELSITAERVRPYNGRNRHRAVSYGRGLLSLCYNLDHIGERQFLVAIV